jgi:hypothetical protein
VPIFLVGSKIRLKTALSTGTGRVMEKLAEFPHFS